MPTPSANSVARADELLCRGGSQSEFPEGRPPSARKGQAGRSLCGPDHRAAQGLFDNIIEASEIIRGSTGSGAFSLSVYPDCVPSGPRADADATERDPRGRGYEAPFCGPCFGAGMPANNGFSIRHTTRNFPNREGSKPERRAVIMFVALMDAALPPLPLMAGASRRQRTLLTVSAAYPLPPRPSMKSAATTALASELSVELIWANIATGRRTILLAENLSWNSPAVIRDSVTTTDELILRRNQLVSQQSAAPRACALSPRAGPGRSKAVAKLETACRSGETGGAERVFSKPG